MINGRVPFNFGLYACKPNKKLIGIHIKFGVGAVDAVGVLHQITSIFKQYDLPIINMGISQNEPSYAFIFLDISENESLDVKELTSKIENIPFVDDVKLIEPPFRGFIFDPYFFPFKIRGERALIFLRRTYEGLIKLTREKIGSGFKAILFHIGFDIGFHVFKKAHIHIAGKDPRKLIETVKAFFQLLGYGIIREITFDMDKSEAIVKVDKCFECEMLIGSKEAEAHFVRGMFAGWFSQLFGKKVNVIETKCIAKGDEYCEFHVS